MSILLLTVLSLKVDEFWALAMFLFFFVLNIISSCGLLRETEFERETVRERVLFLPRQGQDKIGFQDSEVYPAVLNSWRKASSCNEKYSTLQILVAFNQYSMHQIISSCHLHCFCSSSYYSSPDNTKKKFSWAKKSYPWKLTGPLMKMVIRCFEKARDR